MLDQPAWYPKLLKGTFHDAKRKFEWTEAPRKTPCLAQQTTREDHCRRIQGDRLFPTRSSPVSHSKYRTSSVSEKPSRLLRARDGRMRNGAKAPAGNPPQRDATMPLCRI